VSDISWEMFLVLVQARRLELDEELLHNLWPMVSDLLDMAHSLQEALPDELLAEPEDLL